MKGSVKKIEFEIVDSFEEHFTYKLAKFQEYSKNKQDLPYEELQSFFRLIRKNYLYVCALDSSEIKNQREEVISKLKFSQKYNFKHSAKIKTELFGDEFEIENKSSFKELISNVINSIISDTTNSKISREIDFRLYVSKKVFEWCNEHKIPQKKLSQYSRCVISGDISQAFGYAVIDSKKHKHTPSSYHNVMSHHYKKAKAELDKKS